MINGMLKITFRVNEQVLTGLNKKRNKIFVLKIPNTKNWSKFYSLKVVIWSGLAHDFIDHHSKNEIKLSMMRRSKINSPIADVSKYLRQIFKLTGKDNKNKRLTEKMFTILALI